MILICITELRDKAEQAKERAAAAAAEAYVDVA